MAEIAGSNPAKPIVKITNQILEEYLDFLRLSGVTEGHINEVNRALKNYKKYILSVVDKQKSLRYFRKLKRDCSLSYYLKQMYQIKKFLKYIDCNWADNIHLPKGPSYTPKRIDTREIDEAIHFSKNSTHFLQLKSILLLGSSSGLRAGEIYQLNPEDIDLQNRTVYVNHNPKKGQTTKTGRSRISFFDNKTKVALNEYMEFFNNGCDYSRLFPKGTLNRIFRKAPIKVKHLRKYFSQEWDRRGGPTGVKKILMGHSLKGDVDLQHYNAQSEEDLRQIYNKVMETY